MAARTTEVLYLSYDGLTDQLGQSQILPYLCGLSARGFSITIVSFEKPERFATGRQEIETLCTSNGLRWVPLLYHRRPPVLSTLYDLFVLRRVVKNAAPQARVFHSTLPQLYHGAYRLMAEATIWHKVYLRHARLLGRRACRGRFVEPGQSAFSPYIPVL